MKELVTIGITKSDDEVNNMVRCGKEWIDREDERRYPRLDLFGEERCGCDDKTLNGFYPI